MELHDLTLVPFDEFEKKLSGYAKGSIFRLECLQTYSVEYEEDSYKKFLAGESPSSEMMDDWCELVRGNVERGVNFQRVRIITTPLTKYTQYEIEWGYRFSITGGENVNVLIDNNDIYQNDAPYMLDFWLIDDKEGYFMFYDLSGVYIGMAEIPNLYIEKYVRLKKRALSMATPIESSNLLKDA